MTWKPDGMTAWEAATCGAHIRLNDVYCKTIERARARGILDESVSYTLADQGTKMTVLWARHADRPPAVMDVSHIFVPRRDKKYGHFHTPPAIFKMNLRLTQQARNGESKQ